MKSKNVSENILKIIKSSGYKYIDLDTVIDTNLILERSGESFKRFIFSFNDQLGNELCLRPDLTIASCVRYLNQNKKRIWKGFYIHHESVGLQADVVSFFHRFPFH